MPSFRPPTDAEVTAVLTSPLRVLLPLRIAMALDDVVDRGGPATPVDYQLLLLVRDLIEHAEALASRRTA